MYKSTTKRNDQNVINDNRYQIHRVVQYESCASNRAAKFEEQRYIAERNTAYTDDDLGGWNTADQDLQTNILENEPNQWFNFRTCAFEQPF